MQLSYQKIALTKYMKILPVFAYILATDIRLMPSKHDQMIEKFVNVFSSTKNLADSEDEHQAIGIFLSSSQSVNIKDLKEKFNFFDDEEDSPELQKYLFEDTLIENISNLYLINII